MRGVIVAILIMLLSLAMGIVPITIDAVEEVPRISKEELKSKIGNPDVVVIDVRIEQQWKMSERKIMGAVHENLNDVKSWADKYNKDKTIVLY